METFFGIIFSIVVIFAAVFVCVRAIRGLKERKKKFKDGLAYVENSLSQQSFTVSRRIGSFDKSNSTASWYLYVDDSNKKWVMASPMDSYLDKIRDYGDLLAFDFFDEESDSTLAKVFNANQKAMKGVQGAMGAGIGIITGGVLGGGLGAIAGGAGMGAGFTKIHEMLHGKAAGNSGAYGIIIKTPDADVNNPYLVFDFLSILGKSRFKSKLVARVSVAFKHDLKVIDEMREVLGYIHDSTFR